MIKRTQYRRLFMLALLLLAAFACLGYRLVDLQVLRHTELSARAQQNTQREYLFEPRRGDILDCKGNPLATSTTVKVVCADPTLIGNYRTQVARIIAPLLQMSESDLANRLIPRVSQNEKGEPVTNAYVRLKTKVPGETWEKIQATMSSLSFGDEKAASKTQQAFYSALRNKALFTEDYPLRVYPNQIPRRTRAGLRVHRRTQDREPSDS